MSNLSSFFGQQAFDTHSVEAQTDFDIIPAGKYSVIVLKADVKATKNNNGHGIALSMQILDGPHKGKTLRDWINIDNQSSECVEIGRRCLAALGQAIGLTAVADTGQLLNQSVIAHVRVKDNQNNVRTYSSAQQHAVTPAPPAPAPPAPAPVQAEQNHQAPAPAHAPTATPPPWASR